MPNSPSLPISGDRLSWRDMLRALERSEDNIIQALKAEFGPAILTIGDHETRLRSLEQNGSRDAKAALKAAADVAVGHELLVRRVDDIEDARRTEKDQRSGMFSVLRLSNKAILGTAALLVALSVVISVMGDIVLTIFGVHG